MGFVQSLGCRRAGHNGCPNLPQLALPHFMGRRARPPSIRPRRLAQGLLEVALWSSGALCRIGGPRSPAFEIREPKTGKQRYGGFVMECFQSPGPWLKRACRIGSPLDLSSECDAKEQCARPLLIKISYEELQWHERPKTYCPPETQLFSASGAGLKTLSAPSASKAAKRKFVPPRDASHRRRRTPKSRNKLPSRPTAAAGLPR